MTNRERLIREIAYDLWEQEGRPEGHSERLWLAAEARFETEIAERRDDRSEPPAEPAVETPHRPTKRKADAAAEKLARSVKAKVAGPAPEKAPEKEARSAKAKTGAGGRKAGSLRQAEAFMDLALMGQPPKVDRVREDLVEVPPADQPAPWQSCPSRRFE